MTEEEAITVAKRYGLPVVRIPPTGCINEILTVDLRDRRWIIVTREPPDSLPFSAKRSLP